MAEGYSHISGADAAYIEAMYASYCADALSVDESWRLFFAGYDFFLKKYPDNSSTAPAKTSKANEKTPLVYGLIERYRGYGHLAARTNPVRKRKDRQAGLSLAEAGLADSDLAETFSVAEAMGLSSPTPLSEIVARLRAIYLGPIGFEYQHLRLDAERHWFREQCEVQWPAFRPSLADKKRMLTKLNEAVVFENFLHTKYVGQKRFSLEGGETTIVALDAVLRHGAQQGIQEIVMGMAHRGRLNVLANIMGKTYEHIFNEFETGGAGDQTMGDGDVKYHMGYNSRLSVGDGQSVQVQLAPNPSHLEAVDAIVAGLVRAKIDRTYRGDAKPVLPVLIHGDAALAGQGLVYEIAQMSQLDAYRTGGTLHFVINNQIGFTTDFDDARTSDYCTDVAKVVQAPILHVNGDDPEAVVFCIQTALAFRQRFGKDVYVDMVCYRKHGHNESDEPKFTQPSLYAKIARHPNPREMYQRKLSARGEVDAALAKEMEQAFRSLLQDRLNMVKEKSLPPYVSPTNQEWNNLHTSKPADFDKPVRTAVSEKVIEAVGQALVRTPKGFSMIKQIARVLGARQKMFFDAKRLNWASAELLAYGALLLEGKDVRLVGQDTQRGTFSHRHAVLRDSETNQMHNSLAHIARNQGRFYIYNSLLSEYGALGFEYGYAMSHPHSLVLWEAQFGDFANGTQVIIDQFLAAAYTKWQQMNGMVLLLPHGYEGQGPEHSNARPERYLQLASGYNMFVCNPTEPANFFHLLRRQLALPFRMPCIVMSPKSLFRHPDAVSPLSDFTQGGFRPIIGEVAKIKPEGVQKVCLCSGKIYYELRQARADAKREDVALIRLEQLYPLSKQALDEALAPYPKARLCWVQEEPENMGAWTYLLRVWPMQRRIEKVTRKAAASPATGYHKLHVQEQKNLIQKALSL